MDFSIMSQFSTKSLIPPNAGGKAGANIVDLDPTKIVEQFAKMLVAQLSNQDPDNAMDPTEIVSQYAQMTSSLGLAKLTNTQAFYEQVNTAVSTVGKVVTYDDATGTPQTGQVTEVDFTGPFPTVFVNGTGPIPITNVTKIWS